MELQLGADDDDGTARVIDALAKQVLAETALLAFERIGQGFKRPIISPAQHAATAAVVEQRVDGFLEHALFIAHDDVGGVQLNQLLQAVIAVDDAAIQIIEIGGREAAAVERNQRTQLRRNHRKDVQDHPFRLVAGLSEGLDYAEALGELQLLLLRSLGLHPLPDIQAERFDIDLLEQLLDAFGAHHGHEFSGKFLIQLAFALVTDDFGALQIGDFAGIDDDEGFEIEHPFEFAQGDIQQVADARRRRPLKNHTCRSRGWPARYAPAAHGGRATA